MNGESGSASMFNVIVDEAMSASKFDDVDPQALLVRLDLIGVLGGYLIGTLTASTVKPCFEA